MKYFKFFAILTVTIAFIFTACEQSATDNDTEEYNVKGKGKSSSIQVTQSSVDLIAGQNTLIGDVSVDIEGDEMTVTYTCYDGWTLNEIHFHVAGDVDDIPANRRGNPRVGHFMENYEDLQETYYSFTIDISDLSNYNELYTAAHAEVSIVVDDELIEETAWGYGERFVESGNWAMYFIVSNEQ